MEQNFSANDFLESFENSYANIIKEVNNLLKKLNKRMMENSL